MTTAAVKLFREGLRTAIGRGSFATAEKKLRRAMELDASLAGEALLALTEGADARLFDASVIAAYRREAEKNLKGRLDLLARAARFPETKAGLAKSARLLTRALKTTPTPELFFERAETLAKLFWRNFGGETSGFPSSSVRFAKQKKQLPALKSQMHQVAEDFSAAGAPGKVEARRWRGWLARVK